jgi:CAAX amino terminal protease family.
MWKDSKKAPIGEFLGWLFSIWIISNASAFLLEHYSIAYAENGTLTVGYIFYAINGILFCTPSPMIALFITLKRHKKIAFVGDFCKLIFHMSNRKRTIMITGAFCAAALCAALIYGTPTGSPWYLMVFALPVMIIGGGVEEIGWRGFFQPELEKKYPFPLATIMVSLIWYLWHLPIWLLPSSSHYGDSLIGFGITIFIWSFIGAAIYKATKSVFACVMYHAFVNSIGAIFDWNALFDKFPNHPGMYVYYSVVLIASIVLWIFADKKEKQIDS